MDMLSISHLILNGSEYISSNAFKTGNRSESHTKLNVKNCIVISESKDCKRGVCDKKVEHENNVYHRVALDQ